MPYKDIKRKRECARKWAQRDRKLHPEKHKKSVKKWRNKNYEMFLEQKRRWYYLHREERLQLAKKKNELNRKMVIEHYAGIPPKCSCCGESTYEFLTIEHKEGGGGKHRKQIGPPNITRWIIKNNFPPQFDILCYNCNCAKAFNKICPHQLK